MTYLTPVSGCPLEAPLTHLSPCRNTHLFYHIWTWKVLQNMGIVFPHHLLPQWRLMEISMNFHGFGCYLCSWRIYVLDTSPVNFHIWTSKGQGWTADSRRGLGQSIWLVWWSRPYTIYGYLKVKVSHLTTLA